MKITLNNIDDVFRSKLIDIESMELRGYELIENLFVDSSGFGGENEPALTVEQFKTKLAELITANDGVVYTTITDAGQFQVYVGVFKKSGKSQTRKIDNNTTIRTENGYRIIRLHNTDIIKETANGVIFNNGGWATRVTHDRMSKYTTAQVRSRNYETQINGVPLENGKEYNGIRLASI